MPYCGGQNCDYLPPTRVKLGDATLPSCHHRSIHISPPLPEPRAGIVGDEVPRLNISSPSVFFAFFPPHTHTVLTETQSHTEFTFPPSSLLGKEMKNTQQRVFPLMAAMSIFLVQKRRKTGCRCTFITGVFTLLKAPLPKKISPSIPEVLKTNQGILEGCVRKPRRSFAPKDQQLQNYRDIHYRNKTGILDLELIFICCAYTCCV